MVFVLIVFKLPKHKSPHQCHTEHRVCCSLCDGRVKTPYLYILLPQTNFNTVLTREKLKKEQIISELTEKLRKVTQQQEKDKGEVCTDQK